MAACVVGLDPTWTEGSGANEWWVEYRIAGAVITSAWLEIVGDGVIALNPHYGKWAGKPSARLVTGTDVVLHATTAEGEVSTVKFDYLTTDAPETAPCGTCTPSCAGKTCGSDGCGGTCGTCDGGACVNGACAACTGLNPTWAEGSGANNWWVEYRITGVTVTAASLQIVSGPTVTLHLSGTKWVGSSPVFIADGTPVIAHATASSGESVKTKSFGYGVETPVTDVCSPPPDGGTDAGTDSGTDAGTDSGTDAGTDSGTDAGADAGGC